MPRCISPLSLKRGNERLVVPCGKCNFCLQAKRAEWTFRLRQELDVCSSAFFLTLTYDDYQLPMSPAGVPELRKDHVQKFMKRLRKLNVAKLRYYTVGEYGSRTERPHYHSIMFNLEVKALNALPQVWGHGHVHVGDVSPASIHYTTKFHLNKHRDWEEKGVRREKPFLLFRIGPVVSA